MRYYFSFLLAICLFVSCTDKNEGVVMALAERIIPESADGFKFVCEGDSSDYFTLSSHKGKIVIKGNNANSMAAGLNYYLKHYCNVSVSWYSSDKVTLPSSLPLVESEICHKANVKERFFLNYCTFGYSIPWWNWDQWQRLIDWMALNGVNMPLAITGQEAVTQKVLMDLGMSAEQTRAFFTGPAHLPWQRMMNIDRWQGPLPQKMIDRQADLAKKILERERSLNMTPVLPGFSGHVPAELRTIYPDAKITDVNTWDGFEKEYSCCFLTPQDSLFAVFEKKYISEQTKMFGTDHIYGIDLFNEVDSPSWDPETLASMSGHLYDALAAADPQAKWLQMGWMFYYDAKHWSPENVSAYLKAVPQDKLIILDYYCDFKEVWKTTESFYGQPYIFCQLGNFGGETNLEGDIRDIDRRLTDVLENGGTNLVGVGSTLEGFGVNEFTYEFLFDRVWDSSESVDEWLDNLSDIRCGKGKPGAFKVWKELIDSVYSVSKKSDANVVMCRRPDLLSDNPDELGGSDRLMQIWKSLIAIGSDTPECRYDLVNIGRQCLGEKFASVLYSFSESYRSKDLPLTKHLGDSLLAMLGDMDGLLACDSAFSLENWINDARSWGDDLPEKDYYEENARTIITYWGGTGQLTDYAARQWSGLVSSYYAPRWKMFVEEIIGCLESGKEFDKTAFDKKMRIFEVSWTKPATVISYPQAGNPIELSKDLVARYGINS
ncbi:MAG: alpha-N-acetylglucosaminidase [Bacteroidales bacterium]